jgi:hypothetical protein
MASKRKKPMSADDKKQTMMSLLYASGEVFSMKELVKLGASSGVVENTVEDVVRGLVAERLISDDKLGAGIFFWAFPATAFLQTKARTAALEGALAAEEAGAAAAAAREAALSADAAGAAERAAKLAQLAALRARRSALEAEVKAAADFDPAVTAELLAKAKKCKAAADRWTDNLFALKAHLIKKMGMGVKEASAMLGLSDDFDFPA